MQRLTFLRLLLRFFAPALYVLGIHLQPYRDYLRHLAKSNSTERINREELQNVSMGDGNREEQDDVIIGIIGDVVAAKL